ncbi:hypothetical protein PAXINDRAFT_180193 [Paxillus involutus ATCC 200175]|nr:hypothetical protein PAXINDRAFT_180193 [Paxillus involutus ATCC 200175]
MDAQDDFHESRKRFAKELPQLGKDDDGYIEGKVFMIWPPRNKSHRLNLEMVEDSGTYRFEVEVPHRDGITFRAHQRICLALRGARTERRKESSSPHYLPIILKYPDGVMLKYLNGVNQGKVVNTWEGTTDEWYNPGTTQRVSDAVVDDTSEVIRRGPVTEACSPRDQSPSRPEVANGHNEDIIRDGAPPPRVAVANNVVPAQPLQQAQQQSHTNVGSPDRVVKETKARKKRRKKKEREMLLCGPREDHGNIASSADVVALSNGQPKSSTYSSSDNVSHGNLPSRARQACKDSNPGVSLSTDGSITASPEGILKDQPVVEEESLVPALRFQAGVRTERGDIFTALEDLQKGHSMVNIIAVVTSVNPEKKTRTGEWSRSFTVTDPSKFEATPNGTTVTCFQKKYLEWLPQVKQHDVVILRKLRIAEFNGESKATGFSDKLRWAVYDPNTHWIQPPIKGDAPEKEALDDGLSYEFSPYWEPIQDSVELHYCRRIVEWWKPLQEHRDRNVTTVQCSGAARKQHLLISQASPDLPPNGFFKCTVEVLQKYTNNAATTVYVTDYTSNPYVYPVQAAWCPPELSERILQCEMWDSANAIARTMNPGEYWYLHNVRAKWNTSHYMEGKMQLSEKVTQLDETKLGAHPYLRALLARKKEFEESRKSPARTGSPHIFPDMLLQDVDEKTSFLTCTVELLHVDFHSQDGPFIHVTDYTFNHNLPATVSPADWAHSLDYRVLRIKLDDAQASNSQDLAVGSLYRIHNLRVYRCADTLGAYGRLGGEDKLITPLHDLSTHHAQTLQRNKGKWRREVMLIGLSTATPPLDGSTTRPDASTIQQALSSPTHPNMFRIVARVVDYFPFCLEDACVLRCTKCKFDVQPPFNACPQCDDMMGAYSRWVYCLYLRLRDREDREITVSLSGKECTLLRDVEPADFRCDPAAFNKFLAKLNPILGNLRNVHQAWLKNEDKVIDSPQTYFSLESWKVGGETGYTLLSCVPLEGS